MDWFRFYSETPKDTKIRRIARATGTTPAHVVGVWTMVLCFASESPKRGWLYLSDGLPVTDDDITDAAGCNVSETLQEMQRNGMIGCTDGVYFIANWEKRQYASDNSTSRVKKWRDEQKKAQSQPYEGAIETDKTVPQSYCNVTVTRPESESESESESDKRERRAATAELPLSQIDQARSKLEQFGFINPAVWLRFQDIYSDLDQTGHLDWIDKAVDIARSKNAYSPSFVVTTLANALVSGKAPTNGKASSNGKSSAHSDGDFGLRAKPTDSKYNDGIPAEWRHDPAGYLESITVKDA